MNNNLPLSGIKIIDLTNIIMGPYATQLLGDLGADIIKVEDSNGDMTRDIGSQKSSKMSGKHTKNYRNNSKCPKSTYCVNYDVFCFLFFTITKKSNP